MGLPNLYREAARSIYSTDVAVYDVTGPGLMCDAASSNERLLE